jgi:cytochrome b6
MLTALMHFFEERVRLQGLLGFLSRKTVPRHRYSFWYLFGGLALFFFSVQALSGILLLLYYSPTPQSANESVRFLIDRVPYGWLVRSIHRWSANLLVATVFVHLFSTYFMKAYRKPRELTWLSGLVLLSLVLGFGFTGYLLPWDTTAYFATQIGTEIPRSIPLIGETLVTILRGGEYIAEESIKRLFALHVVILPLLTLIVAAFHLTLNQVHGISTPIGIVPKKRSLPFYPNYMYRDTLAWIAGSMLLLALALLYPAQLGAKADPFASAPAGIRPEWYFLPLFETLRLLPGSVLGLSSETVANLGVMLLLLAAFAIPFLDRSAAQERPGGLFTALGIAAIAYMVISIALAYLT